MKQPTFPKVFPALETRRLFLREITSQDDVAIFRNFSDPEIARWFFDHPLQQIEEAQAFIDAFATEFDQAQGLTWAVALRETGACIGTCGYGEVEIGQRAEVGFDLAKAHWGQGLMAEALRAILPYGFDALGLTVIEAHTYSHNQRAIRLLEKLGFHLDKADGESSYFFLMQEARLG